MNASNPTPPTLKHTPAGFVLWFRRHRRERWRIIGIGATEAEASASASCGSGGYYTAPAGVDPNRQRSHLTTTRK